MRRLFPTAAGCLAVAALPLIGCGGSSSSDTGSTPAPAPATDTAADTGGATTAGAQVVMKDIKFVPESATTKAGTTVTWTNNDTVAHTVTGTDIRDGIESGTIEPGKTFAFAFEKAGTVDYVCTIHPGQKGSITVTAGDDASGGSDSTDGKNDDKKSQGRYGG